MEKQIALSYGNARLPDYVRYRVPEIENTPYVAFGKSHYGTLLEGTLALAYGHTGLSIAAFMLPYEELPFHEDLLKGVSRIRAYWEHLAACNENTYAGCAGIVASGWRRAKDPACRFGYGKIDALHGTSLTRLGLAESFETLHAPFLVLKGETVDTLTDEEILPLFSRPVLTDAAALEKLQERGFGRYLPVRAYPTDGRAYAELLPNGKRWQESFFSVGEAGTYRLEGECEPLGELCTSSSESIGISAAVFSAGRARWAAFGYSLWDDLLSSAKRDQIVFAADRICGGLPAYVPSARQVTCIPRVTAEGKTAAVTVVNIGISPVQGLELIVNNPVGGHFVYEREGERCELTPVFSGGRVHLTLPDFVRGWDAATVFIL